MTASPRKRIVHALSAVLLLQLVAVASVECAQRRASANTRTVWAVLFYSSDCPVCDQVKVLADALQKRYPLRFKRFDIDEKSGYVLFERLERIHSHESFSVPTIMVGESILVGESQITGKLEKIVRKLSRSGGASLPYLGGSQKKQARKKQAKKKRVQREEPLEPDPSDCPCDDGRPPTLAEEWGKVKRFFEWLF